MIATFREARAGLAALLLALLTQAATAGQVQIEHARFSRSGDGWRVDVTLRHADTGWDHYADGWRVVAADGTVYGHRTLFHPHVNEQPFARSHQLSIPDGVTEVYVEAHDTVHGWAPEKLAVDLGRDAGPGYEVQR